MFWILPLLVLVALQPSRGSPNFLTDAEIDELIERYVPTDTCTPSCEGVDNDNPLVPDPLDCHTFYLCFDGELNGPMDCPDGEYFNTTEAECVPNGAEECTPICEPGSGGSCSYLCTDPDASLADRFDCSSYYKCSENTTVITCPDETPFFDGNSCQTEESACCHCKPYCYMEDEGKRVMDPLDCTRYYFCLVGNEIPEYEGTCPSGENFDIFKQECSSTAPCITLCTNVIQPDGCISMFTCEELGYFAACPKGCDPRYYHCDDDNDIGNIIEATTCPGDEVFHPDDRRCVDENQCPYTTSRLSLA